MNLPRFVRPVGVYLALLLISLVVAAWAWQERVCGVLYYCSDSLPWELFCLGPFAHLAVGPFGHTGDYYVASEEHLERLRWVFLAVAAVVPALLLWPVRLLARHLTRRLSERLLPLCPLSSPHLSSAVGVAQLASVRHPRIPISVAETQPNRAPSSTEGQLIHWMLERGEPQARSFLAQFERAQITPWRCPCGCASLHFTVAGQPEAHGGLNPVADFLFGEENDLAGIFLYEQGGVLAGLEVYGLAGAAPKTLPTPDLLRPFDTDRQHA